MAETKHKIKKRIVEVPLKVEIIEDHLWLPGFWMEGFTFENDEVAGIVGHTFGMGGGSVFLRLDKPERERGTGENAVITGRNLVDALMAAIDAADEQRKGEQ